MIHSCQQDTVPLADDARAVARLDAHGITVPTTTGARDR
jgi:hypothetical protein